MTGGFHDTLVLVDRHDLGQWFHGASVVRVVLGHGIPFSVSTTFYRQDSEETART